LRHGIAAFNHCCDAVNHIGMLKMQRIILTDLTHFSNSAIFCTAGIDQNSGECVRPMPYLSAARCQELNILPGAILSAEFFKPTHLELPHSEDRYYRYLKFCGYSTSENFRQVLLKSACQTVSEGFGVDVPPHEKVISVEKIPTVSLITIAISPTDIEIVRDVYNTNKIKLHFSDKIGSEYRLISITDLGFYRYAERHHNEVKNYQQINSFLNSQHELFLRIGISRFYQAPDGRAGYWMQINGIYSFPDFFKAARCY
jgi:hypothetical protein